MNFKIDAYLTSSTPLVADKEGAAFLNRCEQPIRLVATQINQLLIFKLQIGDRGYCLLPGSTNIRGFDWHELRSKLVNTQVKKYFSCVYAIVIFNSCGDVFLNFKYRGSGGCPSDRDSRSSERDYHREQRRSARAYRREQRRNTRSNAIEQIIRSRIGGKAYSRKQQVTKRKKFQQLVDRELPKPESVISSSDNHPPMQPTTVVVRLSTCPEVAVIGLIETIISAYAALRSNREINEGNLKMAESALEREKDRTKQCKEVCERLVELEKIKADYRIIKAKERYKARTTKVLVEKEIAIAMSNDRLREVEVEAAAYVEVEKEKETARRCAIRYNSQKN